MSFTEIKNNSDILIISFGGRALQFGSILPFEFLNFLEKHYPKSDKIFLIDKQQNSYHNGIEGISSTIDETVLFLNKKIMNYKFVYCLGVSAGGYAAILFGSLLKVTAVIAFIPQSKRNLAKITSFVDEKYADLLPLINPLTKYHLYADIGITDINSSHHKSHCERLSCFDNVTIYKKKSVNLPQMKKSGELLKIFNEIIIAN
jgi:hypothetical protein